MPTILNNSGVVFPDSTTQTSAALVAAGGAVYENKQIISANYTVTANNNALSSGPITINSGVTVTVPSGSRWVVL